MTNSKKKILIVEDEKTLCDILSERIEKEGFFTIRAEDGQVGLQKALDEHPDLILLDIAMPVSDGISMLKKLRADDWGRNAQVIILTNVSDGEKLAEAVSQGSYKYLIKADWKLEDVVKEVKSVLKD